MIRGQTDGKANRSKSQPMGRIQGLSPKTTRAGELIRDSAIFIADGMARCTERGEVESPFCRDSQFILKRGMDDGQRSFIWARSFSAQ